MSSSPVCPASPLSAQKPHNISIKRLFVSFFFLSWDRGVAVTHETFAHGAFDVYTIEVERNDDDNDDKELYNNKNCVCLDGGIA